MTDGDREILDHLTLTRDRTIELLRRIPDDWLSRTAQGEHHSLGQLFGHVAQTVDHWLETCMKDPRPRFAMNDREKPSLLDALKASRERLVSFFSAEDGEPMGRTYSRMRKGDGVEEQFTGRNRVLYLAQHEAHHRAKIALALRQWGFSDIPFLPY